MSEQVTKAVERLSQMASEIRAHAAVLENWAKEAHENKAVKPVEIGVSLFNIKAMYEVIDTAVKVIYHTKDFLDKAVMPQRLSDAGLDMIRVPEIARSFSVLTKTSASMVDKEKGYQWLRDNNLGDLIVETVNAGTLASAMRNMESEMGFLPPEDIIKVSTYNVTSINRYTPK